MELCSHHHDEIAYEGGSCPMCSLIDDHTRKVDELESTIKDLERDRDDNAATIEELKSGRDEYDAKYEQLQAEIERLCKGQLDGER